MENKTQKEIKMRADFIAEARKISQIKSETASIHQAEGGKLYLFDGSGNAFETTAENLLSFIKGKEIGDARIVRRSMESLMAAKVVALSADAPESEPEAQTEGQPDKESPAPKVPKSSKAGK